MLFRTGMLKETFDFPHCVDAARSLIACAASVATYAVAAGGYPCSAAERAERIFAEAALQPFSFLLCG